MSLLSRPIYWPAELAFRVLGGSTSFNGLFQVTLSTNRKVGWIGRAPKGGSIRKIHFRVGTSVTTDAALDLRVETVGTDGKPTGTLWGTNTNGSSPTTHSINTIYTVTLTADATVARGDLFAIVCEAGATTVSMAITSATETSQLTHASQLPRNALHNSVSWTLDDGYPCMAIEFSDGTFMVDFGMLVQSVTDLTFNSGSAANEEGNYFIAPFTGYAIGAFVRVQSVSAAEFSINLYDSNATPSSSLASVAVGCNAPLLNNRATHTLYFSSRVLLVEGQAYQLCVQATTANNITLERVDLASADQQVLWPFGSGTKRASRVVAGPGTFSYDTTEMLPAIGLVFDELLTDPATGSRFNRGMN